MLLRFFVTCLFISVIIIGESSAKSLNVYTVNYPLFYFAARIGGDKVTVSFPAPDDLDPAFWQPDTATIKEYQQADLIILNGSGYAKWISTVSLPMLRLVNTSKLFQDELINVESTVTHSHGPGGDHSHGGVAFTTWLDFSQAALQAKTIMEAFSKKDKENAKYYSHSFKALEKDLLDLDQKMKSITSNKRLPLLASHPIYQYMARRYDLNLKMVMWEPDVDPGDKEWSNLEKLVGTHPASNMIWEDEPLEKSQNTLEKMGIKSLVFSPCFSKPDHGDFLTIMTENIRNFSILYE